MNRTILSWLRLPCSITVIISTAKETSFTLTSILKAVIVSYQNSSKVNGAGQLTIVFAYTCKHNISLLVYLYVAYSISAPASQHDNNLLTGREARYRETKVSSCRFDTEQTSQPILLNLDVTLCRLFILFLVAQGSTWMTEHTNRFMARRFIKIGS